MILSAVTASALPLAAKAAPIVVFEKAKQSETASIVAEFDVNRELGRAWIRVQIFDAGTSEAPSLPEVTFAPISGLYFDTATNRILYDDGSHAVVCADEKSLLFLKYLKPTGNCAVRIYSQSQTIDDGFELSTQTVERVVFEPRA